MQQQEEAMSARKSSQDENNIRGHIPRMNKVRGFESSQDRLNEAGKEREHLGKVKTGQVNDRKNFWIRSSSADRSNGQGLSPAPRRKRRLNHYKVINILLITPGTFQIVPDYHVLQQQQVFSCS